MSYKDVFKPFTVSLKHCALLRITQRCCVHDLLSTIAAWPTTVNAMWEFLIIVCRCMCVWRKETHIGLIHSKEWIPDLTCWGTNTKRRYEKDGGISRTSKGCKAISCRSLECHIMRHRKHGGISLLCKGTAQGSGMQECREWHHYVQRCSGCRSEYHDRQTDISVLLFHRGLWLLLIQSLVWIANQITEWCSLTPALLAMSRPRWWAAWSCLFPPLLSVKRKRAAWIRAGSAARLQQPPDWPTEPPFRHGSCPLGKQPLLHAALGRGTVVEDITAAMLSSLNPWPCHSKQAGWRRVGKMFVNFWGEMTWEFHILSQDKTNTK